MSPLYLFLAIKGRDIIFSLKRASAVDQGFTYIFRYKVRLTVYNTYRLMNTNNNATNRLMNTNNKKKHASWHKVQITITKKLFLIQKRN